MSRSANSRRRVVLGLLAVGVLGIPFLWAWVGTGAAGPTAVVAAPTGLSHFKCYAVDGPAFQRRIVTLIDQFTTEEETEGGYFAPPVSVVARYSLCAPVSKNGGSIVNENAHLACYRIQPPSQPRFIQRRVNVRNQFGQAALDALAPHSLCLPASKSVTSSPPGAVPTGLDHFKCFTASTVTRFRRRTVTLEDQFGSVNARVERPGLVCNPAEKNGAPIMRPQAHLVCYGIPRGIPPKVAASVRDQFGRRTLTVGAAQTLCLPSFKSEVT